MHKKHIITITGDPASGKGTVTNILKEDLGYEIYRNGQYFRDLAKKHNMSITEFNIYVESHPEIDIETEKSAEKYAKEHDNLIIDARLGWYVVPNSFKIYLKVDVDIAANRAFCDNDVCRKDTENFETIEEQKKDMIKRLELENKRYFDVYGVRKDDMSNYDLVVDTTYMTPTEVSNLIKDEYFKWLNI